MSIFETFSPPPCVKPGIDGPVLTAELSGDGCCPPSLCNINAQGFVCQFVNLLPSGPMWDQAKRDGIIQAQEEALPEACGAPTCPPSSCTTMVDHAIYTARRLVSFAQMFLIPVQQEASPFTAVESLDSWLVSLGWNDCLACEGEPSVTTLLAQAPRPLALAVKRGIAIALTRMSLRPRPTLASINFVIQELGCYLTPELSNDPWSDMADSVEPEAVNLWPGDQMDASGCEGSADCLIRPRLNFALRPHSRTLRAVKASICDDLGMPPAQAVTPCIACGEANFVEAYFDPNANQSCAANCQFVTRLWPGIAAALCIVRSMLPAQVNASIQVLTY